MPPPSRWRHLHVRGVHIRDYTPDDPPIPVTAVEAGKRLDRTPATIRQWARRYQADQIERMGHAVYYDFRDLSTIENCIYRGDPVPATPEERDRLRAARCRAA